MQSSNRSQEIWCYSTSSCPMLGAHGGSCVYCDSLKSIDQTPNPSVPPANANKFSQNRENRWGSVRTWENSDTSPTSYRCSKNHAVKPLYSEHCGWNPELLRKKPVSLKIHTRLRSQAMTLPTNLGAGCVFSLPAIHHPHVHQNTKHTNSENKKHVVSAVHDHTSKINNKHMLTWLSFERGERRDERLPSNAFI